MNKFRLVFLLVIITDILIIFFAPKNCPQILVGEYLKAFIIQVIILIIVCKINLIQEIIHNSKINIGYFYLFLFIFSSSSFYMLWFGTIGEYVFGGQKFCDIANIPPIYQKYL